MSIESPNNAENNPIKITREEFIEYCSLGIDDPKLIEWVNRKGINFDTGFVEVEYEGKIKKMDTSKNNFGTMQMEEGKIIPSGF